MACEVTASFVDAGLADDNEASSPEKGMTGATNMLHRIRDLICKFSFSYQIRLLRKESSLRAGRRLTGVRVLSRSTAACRCPRHPEQDTQCGCQSSLFANLVLQSRFQ